MDASTSHFDPFGAGALERVVATSAVQREVWLADRLGRDASLAFNESITLRFDGPLDANALLAALDGVLARHPSLRATVTPDGAQLLISAAVPGRWSRHDLRDRPAAMRDGALADAALRAVETPFDLAQGPLFRGELLQFADDAHALLLTAHHIVCDGWSWGVVVDDLAALYAEASGVAPAPDSPADVHEAYVRWQDEETAGARGLAHERHWLARFEGSTLPVLELPLDHARPAQRSFASRRLDVSLPAVEVEAIRRAGARHGASLTATLLAGFAGLLHRLGGQDEVVVGVPAAGQAASGLPRLVDHCVNLLPLRLRTDADAPFTRLLASAGDELMDGVEHQALAYGELLAKLPIARDPSRLPLASVMFNVDQALPVATRFAGVRTGLAANPRRYENFELFVNAVQLEGGGVRLECQYATALFSAATVARWLRSYRTLLASVVAEPTAALGALPMLDAVDAAEVVAVQGRLGERVPGLMHDGFVAQSAGRGERPALRAFAAGDGVDALRYADLDARSNRLARSLRGRGIGRGQRVGLCLPRDADMVVALLAVLKAGAAYVPLDPSFPPARLAYYAEDAGLDLLVTTSAVDVAPLTWRADAAGRILMLDRDVAWLAEAAEALAPSGQDATPDDAAYLIYTSGSTGKPKGVAVPHRAVANFLRAMQHQPGLVADARLAAVTTLSFDIAVLELLLPLSVGAEVLLVPRERVLDVALLRELLQTTTATVMQATPGLWRALLDTGWQGGPGFTALVGGEALPPDLARDLLDAVGDVWNLYGPTETTVWSTAWHVERALLASGGVSIGRPILNTTVQVVDPRGQPCPIGVPGEICIGGHGVALGYHDRPDLTAERFVADPLGDETSARRYRTGDRGRWRPDGLLEHLGRLDHQVKVRGYRIELGEIEAALDALPEVSRSVVVVHESRPGDARLVAYVAPAPGAAPEPASLLKPLRQRLPEYMLPQHVMVLPSLPLLPNGKIDRRALPAPTAPGGPARRAPRDDVERQVLAAMEDVLKLPGIGVDDDFFRLGGHSLLAARLVTRLAREFELPLPLRTLFEAPTAERLAAAITARRHASAGDDRLPPASRSLAVDPERRTAPLTPMQERIRFVEELHPGRPTYNTPSAHRLRGPLDVAAFRRAFARMIERQGALRTHVQARVGGGWEQRMADELAFDLPLVDLADAGADAASREGALEARLKAVVARGLDIGRLPLFHAVLYRLAPEHHVFLFAPHHIVWDGWSFDVLYDEMSALYMAELATPGGVGMPLPPAPEASLLDHAAAYVTWLAGAEAASQRRWWTARYASVRPPLPVPTDRPRGAGMSGRGRWELIDLDATTTQAIRSSARALDLTPSMLALTAQAVLLTWLSGGSSVVVGMPVRGRPGGELDHTMGFFNNLLPLPIEVEADATLASVAGRVRHEVLEALTHADVPFEQLAAEPEIAAAGSASGLYQAAFSFQDFRGRPTHWGPLTHANVPLFQDGVTEELGIWLAELEAGMTGGVTYNADLFEADTARNLRDAYVGLLARLATPDAASKRLVDLADPDGLPALERLVAWARAARAARPAEPMPIGTTKARTEGLAAPPLEGRTAVLATVWADLLGIDVADIRAGDNFFDLGGDSLLAMRAVEAGAAVLAERVEARRYIYESLEQIAAERTPAPGGMRRAAATPVASSEGGLLRRLRSALKGGGR